jgi:hypothetical protein
LKKLFWFNVFFVFSIFHSIVNHNAINYWNYFLLIIAFIFFFSFNVMSGFSLLPTARFIMEAFLTFGYYLAFNWFYGMKIVIVIEIMASRWAFGAPDAHYALFMTVGGGIDALANFSYWSGVHTFAVQANWMVGGSWYFLISWPKMIDEVYHWLMLGTLVWTSQNSIAKTDLKQWLNSL